MKKGAIIAALQKEFGVTEGGMPAMSRLVAERLGDRGPVTREDRWKWLAAFVKSCGHTPRPKTKYVYIPKKPTATARAVEVDPRSDEFLRSYKWRAVRMKALLRDGRVCACCRRTPEQHGLGVHVDHIKPRRLFPELALSLENLQVLCEECNHGKGSWDQTD